MSDDIPATPGVPTRDRRASFSPGQPFTTLFGRSPTNNSGAPKPPTGTSAYPGPIATAAAAAQAHKQRRMSISTFGLSGCSPTQTSPFSGGSGTSRRESLSSTSTGSSPATTLDENVIEEVDGNGPSPTTPLARRMSFGAKALRDVRTGEGFNWSESIRSRAERASSINTNNVNNNNVNLSSNVHHPSTPPATAAAVARQRSTTLPPLPQGALAPSGGGTHQQPKPPVVVPDAFQERILKGDFYMD
ncbi:MAG: inositol polyphosphate 5-phosphatase [Watsoniomyces obsoletus]|nr:MAG: inositol polyphosphate 5-phosphatase [Watsoniomyces obsoletus]